MTTSLLDPAILDRIQGLALVAHRVVEGALHGLHRSPMQGLSIEFVQHREYAPGDELKHLDWKVIARSDRYVVKQYEQETNLRAVLVVDCSASMGYGAGVWGLGAEERKVSPTPELPTPSPQTPDPRPQSPVPSPHSKFAYARILAASLGHLLIHQGDSVGLVMAADGMRQQLDPSAKPGQVLSICQTLETREPVGKTDLAGVLAQLAAKLRRRSLVVLISDLLDDPEKVLSTLGQLHHGGHEVIVFQVLDPREISFDLGLAGRGVTVLRDMETGAEFEAEPMLIRDLVCAEVQRFLDLLDTGCRHHGLHLERCTTDQQAEEVLVRYLTYRLHAKR